MSRLVVRIKVLPEEVDTDLEKLSNDIKVSLPDGISIKAERREPIAFGLNALMMDFLMEDKEGQMDRLEEILRSREGVSEIQIVNLSRESARL